MFGRGWHRKGEGKLGVWYAAVLYIPCAHGRRSRALGGPAGLRGPGLRGASAGPKAGLTAGPNFSGAARGAVLSRKRGIP